MLLGCGYAAHGRTQVPRMIHAEDAPAGGSGMPASPARARLAASLPAGLLTGAVAGSAAALVCVPWRRVVDAPDRSYVSGLTLVLGALLLWTFAGLLHGAALAHRRRSL